MNKQMAKDMAGLFAAWLIIVALVYNFFIFAADSAGVMPRVQHERQPGPSKTLTEM